MNFTPEQLAIFDFVKHGAGNGIIDAVAGAGKTTTIMECARHIPANTSRVLFSAFNKSISKEITEKLSQRGLKHVTVKTIHALGYQMLTSYAPGRKLQVEDSKYSKLLKNPEIQTSLKPYYENIIRMNGLDVEHGAENKSEGYAINRLMFRINKRLIDINQKFRSTLCKSNMEDFKNLVSHFGIFNEYELKQKEFNIELQQYFDCSMILLKEGNNLSERTLVMDFTDMIYLPYVWKLAATTEYDFLFVDECQDLSKAQLAVVLKYGHESSRILSVGDPFQSIYGFTGADIKSFENVKKFTEAAQLPLTTCFRCPRKVIEIAKSIRPDISGIKTEDGIVEEIKAEQVVKLAKQGDLIISRVRAPLIILVFNFIDEEIKVQIHEEEVKEVISDIRSIFKQDELQSKVANIPNGFEGIKSTVLKREEWVIRKEAERIMNKTERDLHIENEINYLKQKLEFLHRKYELWKHSCASVGDVIEKIRQYISATHDSVRLSTIHRAKGLENDRVFILDYDELPRQHLEQKDWEKTQEVNLKYVAVTRAKKELFLVSADKVEILQKKSLFDVLPFDKD
jgi:DNA helicase-2/ATP-dependent DNA helicase PcrA